MKYQQLENLENGWKWNYLMRKSREGEAITCHIESSMEEEAIAVLAGLENEPSKLRAWMQHNLHPELDKRMKQAIRARRKRHFNAEKIHTRKKSIDLEFLVWQRLSNLAGKRRVTLSEAVVQLIEDAEQKDKFAHQMLSLKQDLKEMLGKETEK